MIFQLFLFFSIVKTLFKRNLSQEPGAEGNLKHSSPPESGKRSPFSSTAPGHVGEQPVPSVVPKPWACGRQGHREGQAHSASEADAGYTVGFQRSVLVPKDQCFSNWSKIQELARNFFTYFFILIFNLLKKNYCTHLKTSPGLESSYLEVRSLGFLG